MSTVTEAVEVMQEATCEIIRLRNINAEMLEALKIAEQWCRCFDATKKHVHLSGCVIEAAIHKAKGGQ